MRRLLFLIVLVALIAIGYSVLSDPEKRAGVLGTIEGSTGVDLSAEPKEILEDTGKAVGDAAQQVLKDLGNTLTDPAFYESLENWGRDTLEKLDDSELERLKKDLQRESGKNNADYDSVLERYLGKATDS